MIRVRVRDNDSLDVGELMSQSSQSRSQPFKRSIIARPRVDQRERVFFDQVNIDGTDVERSRHDDSVKLHGGGWGAGVGLGPAPNPQPPRAIAYYRLYFPASMIESAIR